MFDLSIEHLFIIHSHLPHYIRHQPDLAVRRSERVDFERVVEVDQKSVIFIHVCISMPLLLTLEMMSDIFQFELWLLVPTDHQLKNHTRLMY